MSERDEIYKGLPPIIKRIVSAEHVEHDLKWPVIAYLHIFERMNEKEIVDWLFEQANWDDLTRVDVTKYHVNWTCNWARNKIDEEEAISRKFIPLPYYIKIELNKDLFGFSKPKDQHERTIVFQYYKDVLRKFLRSLESEPSEELRT